MTSTSADCATTPTTTTTTTSLIDLKSNARVHALVEESLKEGVVIPPFSGKHRSTLIFLHGLGDSGSSWASQLLATMRQQLPDTKIVCPTAPTGAVTCNHGAEMTRWHDIQRFEAIDDDAFEKYDGLSDSVDIVRGLVQRELDAGIAPSKIVLGGFSQGGALSLFAGLSLPVTIGGVVSLSGYGVKRNELVNKLLNDKSKQTKVFIGHGTSDNVVKYASGDLIAKLLGSHGVNVQFTGYNVMHFTSAKELRDAKDFIKNCFADE